VVGHPTNPNRYYVNAWGGGIFQTSDHGATWAPTATQPGSLYTVDLALAPSAPATLHVVAELGGYRSTDGGATWTPWATTPSAYVNCIAIDPVTSTRIVAGQGFGIDVSTDGGDSWSPASGIALRIAALAFDPTTPSVVYAGTSQGVYKSTDGGATWQAQGIGMNDASIQALAINPTTTATLYAGGTGTVFKSTNSALAWTTVATYSSQIDAGTMVVDPLATSTVYLGLLGAGLHRSADAGASWVYAGSGMTNPVVMGLALDPTASANGLAATAGGGVWRTTTGGL